MLTKHCGPIQHSQNLQRDRGEKGGEKEAGELDGGTLIGGYNSVAGKD